MMYLVFLLKAVHNRTGVVFESEKSKHSAVEDTGCTLSLEIFRHCCVISQSMIISVFLNVYFDISVPLKRLAARTLHYFRTSLMFFCRDACLVKLIARAKARASSRDKCTCIAVHRDAAYSLVVLSAVVTVCFVPLLCIVIV